MQLEIVERAKQLTPLPLRTPLTLSGRGTQRERGTEHDGFGANLSVKAQDHALQFLDLSIAMSTIT